LWLFAFIEFSFPAKSNLEGLLQKSEQFFRGTEIQPIAGINLFHPSLELASCGIRSGSEPNYKSSSHVG